MVGRGKYQNSEEDIKMNYGDVYFADLRSVIGSEQGGVKPVLIIRDNSLDNQTVIAVPICYVDRGETEVSISMKTNKLEHLSNLYINLEQIRCLDKKRIKEKIGTLPLEILYNVKSSLLKMIESVQPE